MSIRVLFFATLADVTGTPEMLLDASAFPNVASIYDRLTRDFPKLEAHRPSVLYAVNSEFARSDSLVHDGDEVAFFPPVSGG